MERRSRFLTFLFALIPGAGYMYLGQMIKGLEVLVAYFLAWSILGMVGLGFLKIILMAVWFYTFFDTFNLARKIDAGQSVSDEDIIFNRIKNSNLYKDNSAHETGNAGEFGANKNAWIVFAWILIILGFISILNRFLRQMEIYNIFKSYASMYLIPILFIAAGVYLLFKNQNKKS